MDNNIIVISASVIRQNMVLIPALIYAIYFLISDMKKELKNIK